ncbi:MAG: hypothetical protein SGPRY_008145, partial [Prymnesium sp.]
MEALSVPATLVVRPCDFSPAHPIPSPWSNVLTIALCHPTSLRPSLSAGLAPARLLARRVQFEVLSSLFTMPSWRRLLQTTQDARRSRRYVSQTLALTASQASNPAERARVEATGAQVQSTVDGKLRVGGVIQVTRSLGDRKLRQFGLIPEPEVRVHTMEPADNAIVMASDGLWDVLTPQRVNHVMRNTAKSPDMIAKRLVEEAWDAGSEDNVTVNVVFLRDLSFMT